MNAGHGYGQRTVDIGVFLEGVLKSLELLIESTEQLRGGHCLEFRYQAFCQLPDEAFAFGDAMPADVMATELLVAKGW